MSSTAPSPSPQSQQSAFESIFRISFPDKTSVLGKRKSTGNRQYECLICEDPSWKNRKRDNAMNHAIKAHPTYMSGTKCISFDAASSEVSSVRPTIDSFFSSRPSDISLRAVFSRQRYTEAIVGLLTRRRLPFSMMTWDEMCEVILAANPTIEDMLLKSRYVAMKHISSNFDLYSSQLRAKLAAAQSMIHIATDLWTSPHCHGLLGICARWIDEDYTPQKALLAMPECRYSHHCKHQAALILETLVSFGAVRRVGYHTGDNASSNNTCLQHLSEMLKRDHNVSSIFSLSV